MKPLRFVAPDSHHDAAQTRIGREPQGRAGILGFVVVLR